MPTSTTIPAATTNAPQTASTTADVVVVDATSVANRDASAEYGVIEF